MHMISAAALESSLAIAPLLQALRAAFQTGVSAPRRLHYPIPLPASDSEGTLLMMPAWIAGQHIGIKLVTVFPHNARQALPSVMGTYVLLDATTGAPLAMIDAPMLTLLRTAAASALAAGYLARPDSTRLLMIGTGQLAPYLARAHSAVRPIQEIIVWGRNTDKAQTMATYLARQTGLIVRAVSDLPSAVAQADIISCATLAKQPLLSGAWVQPGTHIDLVGGFTPTMREADDACVQRASLFVDTRDGAMAEAGDIADPLQRGIIAPTDILADLFDLTRGLHGGRQHRDEITLFKSVGHALEDLAAAQLAYRATHPAHPA